MSKKQNFEQAFQRLEEIAQLLESDGIALQQSIELYEEGMKLVKACASQLDAAEKKLLQLSRTESGFDTTPLDSDEAE